MKLSVFLILLTVLVQSVRSLRPADCRCRLFSSSKIIGGKSAPLGKFPWMVSLGVIEVSEQVYDSDEYKMYGKEWRKRYAVNDMLNTHTCGGVVLNERWILTAAHCRPNDDTKLLGVGSGDSLREVFLKGRNKVKRFVIHPMYVQNRPEHDIALIELETDLTLADSLQPACLPAHDYELESRQNLLLIAGFGDIRSRLMFSDRKEKDDGDRNTAHPPPSVSDLAGISTNRLKELYMFRSPQAASTCANGQVLCMEAVEGGKGEFTLGQGDSGSPLMLTLKGQTVVIGVDSSTRTVNNFLHNLQLHSGSLNYFTSVFHNIDFIRRHLNEQDLCLSK